MAEPRYVYVAEVGCYSDRYLGGVYETAEAAMAAYPNSTKWTRSAGDYSGEPYEEWANDLDWDDRVRISREEVSSGPVNPANAGDSS